MTDSACPRCGAKGRVVKPTTLLGVLTDRARHHADSREPFRFCATEECPVVYYGGAIELGVDDVLVPVFQKSPDPARPVCYCFSHTVKNVQDDARRNGKSVIADDVAKKCRAGLDRCEEENPQGTCCLGNVRRVAKTVLDSSGEESNGGGCGSCCCGDGP